MQHASRSCTTSFLFGPSTHTMIREACSARGVLRATTLAQRPSRLPEVRWTDFSGAPASRSDTRRRSSTLPEVRCSDVSGPPASRSYTRWPQLHLQRPSRLPEVRWTDFSGAPASRSDTRRRSSTLPEVRCSDVSGPPASRSYTRWPQLHLARSPLQRERCVEGGSLEAAAKRQKFWTEASICTSSLWIEFAFGFCTMTLVHF